MAVRTSWSHFGYQAVALGPEIRDFSIILTTLSGAKEFIAERGSYYDAMWVIIGPDSFYTHDGAQVSTALHRVIRDALLNIYSTNTTSLTIGFPLNYVFDRCPLPTDQRGGYSAVIVQYSYSSTAAALLKNGWCISRNEAVRALQNMSLDSEVPGPMFKAIVGGPEDIYDKHGKPASRELYESVKGMNCHVEIADSCGAIPSYSN